jgi:hypothetical protein
MRTFWKPLCSLAATNKIGLLPGDASPGVLVTLRVALSLSRSERSTLSLSWSERSTLSLSRSERSTENAELL